MKKEIVTGERLGFNNLSQDLRDVFVHGLRKDDEGKFRQVLNSIAADSQRVSITDERGHFKPKTNEEIFTQLISLTAKAALFEADGGDTHSSEYYALIKKTDVDLTRKLESVWANRDRQVEVSESRVAAKAWGKSSVEKGAEAVIDDLLNRADKWVNLTLIDNLVAAYDNRLSKAAAGTVVVSEIVTLLAGCNPPPAEVQEIQSPQQISGVVTREILTKIAADPKNQEVAAYVKDDMDRILADFNGRFIPGTEMLYYIDNGGKMTRWVFGAEAREDGQMGVKVLGYCNDSDECQVVDKAFLTKEKDGAKVYGYVDEAGNSHGVIAYVGEDTYAFDYEGNSHSDNRDNGKNLLDAIMSIGVTSVQAAADQLENPSEDPLVEATATDEVDQKEQLVTAMVDDFLNSRGEFTDEKITENAMTLTVMDEDKGVLGISGISSEPKGMITGQSVLIDLKLEGDVVNVLVGGIDQNDKRMVYVMNFPLSKILVRVDKSKINLARGEGVAEKSFYLTNESDLQRLLEKYRSKPFVGIFRSSEQISVIEQRIKNETDPEVIKFLERVLEMTKNSALQADDLVNRLKPLNDDYDTEMPDSDNNTNYVLSTDGFQYEEWEDFSGPAPCLIMFDFYEGAENK